MIKCKDCSGKIGEKTYMSCPNCGAQFCEPCASKTKNICPNCYASLELK